ncbi:hypothetical protein LTR84_009671 [Exophiala bonariae]|uniref:glutathione transferase n=1 Tax=Exophiala bonariae TaxID=1690606 RepID=A0AAV9NLD6_9EURO|nr:hypothetical protein LTR84_009671 [Exophiala bonariae]
MESEFKNRVCKMSRLINGSSPVSRLLHSSRMPGFILYGARGSTNTDRVRLTLAEGGLSNTDYELVLLNLQQGEQKSKENLARHRWGKVPSISVPESGFTLFESRAICKFLARKYSIPLVPPESDLEATALFDQAQSIETSYFAPAAGTIAFEKFAKKFMGLEANEAVVSDALQSVNSFLDIAEGLLQEPGRGYMAGSQFTLVDLFYIPLVLRLFACGYGDVITNREAVNAWWNHCISRPAIKKLLEADKEAMAAAMAKR